MLYCEKCRSGCPDSAARCPNCKSTRLRAAAGDDMVLLHRADEYTAQRLCALLEEQDVPCKTEPCAKRGFTSPYDMETMPTDKNVYVRWDCLEQAQAVSAALREELEKEQAAEVEFEDMPQGKRITVQILSAIAFILLVIGVVFGADALANWLKGLLGI